MMVPVMMSAMGLLQRRQRLLGTLQITILQALSDLVEGIGEGRVRGGGGGGRAALELTERCVRLLRARKIS